MCTIERAVRPAGYRSPRMAPRGMSGVTRPPSQPMVVLWFLLQAANLVAGDLNGHEDVFVHDRQSGENSLVSVASDGTQGDLFSQHPTISSDGRYVAFKSDASNLVGGDTNHTTDVFVHDRQSGDTWIFRFHPVRCRAINGLTNHTFQAMAGMWCLIPTPTTWWIATPITRLMCSYMICRPAKPS